MLSRWRSAETDDRSSHFRFVVSRTKSSQICCFDGPRHCSSEKRCLLNGLLFVKELIFTLPDTFFVSRKWVMLTKLLILELLSGYSTVFRVFLVNAHRILVVLFVRNANWWIARHCLFMLLFLVCLCASVGTLSMCYASYFCRFSPWYLNASCFCHFACWSLWTRFGFLPDTA